MESGAVCLQLAAQLVDQALSSARSPVARSTKDRVSNFSLEYKPPCLALRDTQYGGGLLGAETERTEALTEQKPIDGAVHIRVRFQNLEKRNDHLVLLRQVIHPVDRRPVPDLSLFPPPFDVSVARLVAHPLLG